MFEFNFNAQKSLHQRNCVWVYIVEFDSKREIINRMWGKWYLKRMKIYIHLHKFSTRGVEVMTGLT